MNITQSGAAAAGGEHEISLRTMASDIASLEHGSQVPVPAHLVAKQTDVIDENSVKVQAGGISVFRLILALIFLACVGVGMYIYVYPYITGAVRP